MRPGRLLVAFTLLLATTSLAPRARAADPPASPEGQEQDPAQDARAQYTAGMQAYQAKRFVEAALHFEAAAAIRMNAVAIYTAALAWEQSNHPERAADDFLRSLDVNGLSPAQAQNARDRLTILERTMGSVTVTAPAGWRVQLDAFTQVPAPATLHGTPGVHVLHIDQPGKPTRQRDVTIELGKATALDLTNEPAVAPAPTTAAKPVSSTPEPAPPVQAPPQWLDTRRAVGIGVASAGVGTLLGAILLGTSAGGAKDAYDAAPTRASFDHASSLQTWTNVALVTGVVLVAGGAALVLWPSPKAKESAPSEEARASAPAPRLSLVPSLGGASLRGQF